MIPVYLFYNPNILTKDFKLGLPCLWNTDAMAYNKWDISLPRLFK